MNCHNHSTSFPNTPHRAGKLLLVGNPNAGKSAVFNALTGLYAEVSNFPGTTVDIASAPLGEDILIDTPGIYGVSSFNDEERVARDIILEGDTVINVVNAMHLERDLFLTLQLIDMQIPMVVALNMTDEATRHGIKVDIRKLESELGVPVVPLIAVRGHGIDALKEAMKKPARGKPDPFIAGRVSDISGKVPDRRRAVLILENDTDLEEKCGIKTKAFREEIYARRRARVNSIVRSVVQEIPSGNRIQRFLGHLMLNPLTGVPILAGVLYLLYQIIGIFVAGTVVGFTEAGLMQTYYEPLVRQLVSRLFPVDTAIGELLVGEFGLLTMTVTYLFGLLLPLVVGFYIALSLMEDSGYLPRVAVLVDRLFSFLGLNGRAVIPVILGFGCVTMATMTTRILGSRRERTIATILLALSIPCSAQLGVIIGMLGAVGTSYAVIYVLVIGSIFGLIGTILNKVLPGTSTDLFIDLPPLRWPRLDNIARKTLSRSVAFIKEAAPLFLVGSLLIGVLKISGLLEGLQGILAPITEGWLKLPRETATAFIMGVIRRDFGAAGLTALSLTPVQTLVSLITLTLFVPCIASIIVILKERSLKEGLAIVVVCFGLAFVVGGIVSHLMV